MNDDTYNEVFQFLEHPDDKSKNNIYIDKSDDALKNNNISKNDKLKDNKNSNKTKDKENMLSMRKKIINNIHKGNKFIQNDTSGIDWTSLSEKDALYYFDDSGLIDMCLDTLSKLRGIIHIRAYLYNILRQHQTIDNIITIINTCMSIGDILFKNEKISNMEKKSPAVCVFMLFIWSKDKFDFYRNIKSRLNLSIKLENIQINNNITYVTKKYLELFLSKRKADPRYNISDVQRKQLLESPFNFFDYANGLDLKKKRGNRL